MLVLGIDTSTWAGSIALSQDGRIIGEVNILAEKTHTKRLISAVHFLLSELDLTINDVDGFAIAIGPGSFTGLRIGLSTVKGFSFATGVKVVPISTLYAMAMKAKEFGEVIYPMLDAGRGEVYTACYLKKGEDILPEGKEMVISPELFLRELTHLPGVFYGDGALRYRELIERETKEKRVVLDISPFIGEVVARRGEELLREGKGVDPAILEPNYIRPSDAELARLRKR